MRKVRVRQVIYFSASMPSRLVEAVDRVYGRRRRDRLDFSRWLASRFRTSP